MAEIQQNRWDQLVRRVAGLIGPGSKVDNTIGDLFPMLDVENVPSELLFLSGWRLYVGGGRFQSAAGQIQHMQLFNPADSGMIIVLEQILVSTLVSATINLLPTLTQFVSQPGGGNARDLRVGLRPSVAIIGELSSAAAFSADSPFRVPADVTFPVGPQNDVAVLSPGTGFNVTSDRSTETLHCVFFWRERVAEQSELNF